MRIIYFWEGKRYGTGISKKTYIFGYCRIIVQSEIETKLGEIYNIKRKYLLFLSPSFV